MAVVVGEFRGVAKLEDKDDAGALEAGEGDRVCGTGWCSSCRGGCRQ